MASNNEALLKEMKEVLVSCFKMTDLGPIHHVLGLQVIRDLKSMSISINQACFTNQLLKKCRMSDCHPVSTPLDTSNKLLPLSNDEEIIDKSQYHSVVGSLLHLVIITRPDIMTAVGMVARHVEKPGQRHWTAIKYILHYLRGTVTYGLVYRSNDNDTTVSMDVFCDADWVGDVEK